MSAKTHGGSERDNKIDEPIDIGLTEKTRLPAIALLSKVTRDVFYGKNPIALAAAAVYISCKNNAEQINQFRMASLAGISNVSLRNMYVLLKGNTA